MHSLFAIQPQITMPPWDCSNPQVAITTNNIVRNTNKCCAVVGLAWPLNCRLA